ncbi:MAG: response regulator transcription factor [Rhodospirillaceae bacterium]|nr:response regulator transcription factor [Rhodospirillaceae bacterium]
MTTATTVLIVDDEPAILRFLRNTLAVQNYNVVEAATAADALVVLRRARPDLLILDLGLPDRDGLEVIAEVRKANRVPIVVLSSRGDERTKVTALDAGADDYITKPFGVEELMARVRSALRRKYTEQGAEPVFSSGGLEVDLTRRSVRLRGAEVKLSPKEYDILAQLVIHAGKVLTHRHLLREVWGGETAVDVQYLRVYVRQLRQKIERTTERPEFILTEPGVGYRLNCDA